MDKGISMAKCIALPDFTKPDDEKTLEELIRELQYRRAESAYLKSWISCCSKRSNHTSPKISKEEVKLNEYIQTLFEQHRGR